MLSFPTFCWLVCVCILFNLISVHQQKKINRKATLVHYTKGMSEKIGRILKQYKIKCTHVPINKMSQMKISEKDKIPLGRYGTWRIRNAFHLSISWKSLSNHIPAPVNFRKDGFCRLQPLQSEMCANYVSKANFKYKRVAAARSGVLVY